MLFPLESNRTILICSRCKLHNENRIDRFDTLKAAAVLREKRRASMKPEQDAAEIWVEEKS